MNVNFQAGQPIMRQQFIAEEDFRMHQQPLDPDVICQQSIQAKLNAYQAREQFECSLKAYNDQLDTLVNLVGIMKERILELERIAGKEEHGDST